MNSKHKFSNLYLGLIPLALGVFVAADDQTVMVTILPEIMRDTHSQITELDTVSWIITAYLLGYLCVIPFMGSVSDVAGRQKSFVISMGVFILGSVLVAIAPLDWSFIGLNSFDSDFSKITVNYLVFVRVIQAVGAGALLPIGIASIGDMFTSSKRAFPMGILSSAAEAGGVVGPFWGGIFVRFLNWRWTFWSNIPIGFGLIAISYFLPKYTQKIKQTPIDKVGSGVLALFLITTTLVFSQLGISTSVFLFCVLVSCILAAILFWLARNDSNFLIPIDLIKTRGFIWLNLTHFFVGVALIIVMITVPLMATTILEKDSFEGGLMLLKITLAIPFGAFLAGGLCRVIHYKWVVLVGLFFTAIGLALMYYWITGSINPVIPIQLITTGFGFGVIATPVSVSAIELASSTNRGISASLVTSSRLFGMTVGISAISSWGSYRFGELLSNAGVGLSSLGSMLSTGTGSSEIKEVMVHIGEQLFSEFLLIGIVVLIAGFFSGILINHNKQVV